VGSLTIAAVLSSDRAQAKPSSVRALEGNILIEVVTASLGPADVDWALSRIGLT